MFINDYLKNKSERNRIMKKHTMLTSLMALQLSIFLFLAILLKPVILFGADTVMDIGRDAMIVPYFQDFNDVSVPDLPSGWHKIVYNPDYAQATVGTSSSFAPKSPPNHVRLLSNNSADQEVLLITPEATDFNNIF